MKNNELLSAVDALNHLEVSKTTLPIKVGYIILQNRKKMRDAVEPLAELRNGIIKKWSGGGTVIKETDHGYKECLAEINELGQEEQDIDLKKIKLSDIENVELSAELISALMCMIEE